MTGGATAPAAAGGWLLPLLKHHAQALVRTVEDVGQDIGTGNAGIEGHGDEVTGDLRLCHEALIIGDGGFGPAHIVFRPGLRQIQPPINQCVAEAAGVTEKHAALTILSEVEGSIRPAVPDYCRATPTECSPFFKNPVSSTTSTPSGLPSVSTT